MQSPINSNEDVKNLAELLFPEVISTLGNNECVGVRVLLERPIKTLFSKDEPLKDFQRAMLRQYSAMKLDTEVLGLGKGDN